MKIESALLLKQLGTCLALENIATGVDSTGVTDRDKHAAKPSNKHSGIILPPKVFPGSFVLMRKVGLLIKLISMVKTKNNLLHNCLPHNYFFQV